MYDNKQVWHDVLEQIKISVSPAIFSTWFTQTHISSLNKSGGRVTVEIGCATSFARKTIEERYFGLVQENLMKSFGLPCDIVFIVKDDPNKIIPQKNSESPLFQEPKVSSQIPPGIIASA